MSGFRRLASEKKAELGVEFSHTTDTRRQPQLIFRRQTGSGSGVRKQKLGSASCFKTPDIGRSFFSDTGRLLGRRLASENKAGLGVVFQTRDAGWGRRLASGNKAALGAVF